MVGNWFFFVQDSPWTFEAFLSTYSHEALNLVMVRITRIWGRFLVGFSASAPYWKGSPKIEKSHEQTGGASWRHGTNVKESTAWAWKCDIVKIHNSFGPSIKIAGRAFYSNLKGSSKQSEGWSERGIEIHDLGEPAQSTRRTVLWKLQKCDRGQKGGLTSSSRKTKKRGMNVLQRLNTRWTRPKLLISGGSFGLLVDKQT